MDRAATSYVVTDLNPNTTYYFTVRVVDTGGLYSDSNQVNAKTLAAVIPDRTPPSIKLISPQNTTYGSYDIQLIWSANESIDWSGYSLNGGTNETIEGNHTIRVSKNGIYDLVLYANDTSGNMASIKVQFEVSVDIDPPVITHIPVADGVEGEAIQIYAMITDNVAVKEAFIYYRRRGETSYIKLNLTKCEKCIDAYDATIPASSVNVPIIEYYILASDGRNTVTDPSVDPENKPHIIWINLYPTPVILKSPTDVTDKSLKLIWTESTENDFKNYTVFKSDVKGSIGSPIYTATNIAETSYTVKGLDADTTYYFTIRIYDTGGLYADSNQISIKTKPPQFPWLTIFASLLVLAATIVALIIIRRR